MQVRFPERPSYSARRDIRRVALCVAGAISAAYPELRVDIDLDTVDGEDAFVWIHIPRGVRPAGLETLVRRLVRRQARTHGRWIVPRIVSSEFDSGPVFRLRPRLSEAARPLVF